MLTSTGGESALPTNDAKIYLSLWGTDTLSDWLGVFEDPGRPIAMDVERVRKMIAEARVEYPIWLGANGSAQRTTSKRAGPNSSARCAGRTWAAAWSC